MVRRELIWRQEELGVRRSLNCLRRFGDSDSFPGPVCWNRACAHVNKSALSVKQVCQPMVWRFSRERLLGVQEVPGSNPGGPTKSFQTLTAETFVAPRVLASTWSPKWTPSAQPGGPERGNQYFASGATGCWLGANSLPVTQNPHNAQNPARPRGPIRNASKMEVKRETDDRDGSEPVIQLPASAPDASFQSDQSCGCRSRRNIRRMSRLRQAIRV
jgi:hypothetical protein